MALEARCYLSATFLALLLCHHLMLVGGFNSDSKEAFMYNRVIRTPSFRNNEIMTARGFGKRENSHLEVISI